jgi:hypothetical protein
MKIPSLMLLLLLALLASVNLTDLHAAPGQAAPLAEKAKADKTKTLEGTFVRIDEGDYFHWVIKSTEGEERSFFILKPDASVDKVVEAPENYVGKKCRITWKASKEEIPEAGGKIDIEQVLSVQWLGKK